MWSCVALLALAPAATAGEPLDEDFGLWLEYVTLFEPRPGGVPLSFEAQGEVRLRDDAGEMGQARAEGFVGWDALDDLQLGAGFLYAYRYAELDAARDISEYRPYVAVDLGRDLYGPVGAILRLRLDMRIFDGLDPVGWRLVPRFGVELQVARFADMRLELKVWDEPRFGLNEVQGAQREGFIENRAYAGLELQLAAGLSVNVGYINRYFPGRKDEVDVMEHVIQVGFQLAFR